jgi:hypothetical protein
MARFNSTVQRAVISAASGTTAVVAAQGAGKRIKVLRVMVMSKAAADVKFQSASTDITGTMGLAAGGGWRDGISRNADDPDDCLFQTAANEALNINQSAASTVGGYIAYVVGT